MKSWLAKTIADNFFETKYYDSEKGVLALPVEIEVQKYNENHKDYIENNKIIEKIIIEFPENGKESKKNFMLDKIEVIEIIPSLYAAKNGKLFIKLDDGEYKPIWDKIIIYDEWKEYDELLINTNLGIGLGIETKDILAALIIYHSRIYYGNIKIEKSIDKFQIKCFELLEIKRVFEIVKKFRLDNYIHSTIIYVATPTMFYAYSRPYLEKAIKKLDFLLDGDNTEASEFFGTDKLEIVLPKIESYVSIYDYNIIRLRSENENIVAELRNLPWLKTLEQFYNIVLWIETFFLFAMTPEELFYEDLIYIYPAPSFETYDILLKSLFLTGIAKYIQNYKQRLKNLRIIKPNSKDIIIHFEYFKHHLEFLIEEIIFNWME